MQNVKNLAKTAGFRLKQPGGPRKQYSSSSSKDTFKPRPPRTRESTFEICPDDQLNKTLRNVTLQKHFKDRKAGDAEYHFLKCNAVSVESFVYLIKNFINLREMLLAVKYIEELADCDVDKGIIRQLLIEARSKGEARGTFSRLEKIRQIAAEHGIQLP